MTMKIAGTYISCGVRQLYNLRGDDTNYKKQLWDERNALYVDPERCTCPQCRERSAHSAPVPVKRRCAFVIFSDADEFGNGLRFSKWLMEQNVGAVVEVSAGVNPNTKRGIRLWSWEIPDSRTFDKVIGAGMWQN